MSITYVCQFTDSNFSNIENRPGQTLENQNPKSIRISKSANPERFRPASGFYRYYFFSSSRARMLSTHRTIVNCDLRVQYQNDN